MIFCHPKNLRNNKSFTLIELLIVIAILALLMSIIIITLNPSEMLKKSRDTKRISNVKSINTALGIFQATKPTTSTGTANIVYISIPDSSSTCANLGLPSLPSGYTYQCSTSANYRKTDGTGWIPVNFDSLDIGSPLSSLPIDPTNTTSTGLYFTYVTGGSWELTSQFESFSYSEQASTDGGIDSASFELGTDLTLSPFTHGLVGYWKFDESGTSALDSSGFSNTGTIYSSTIATDLHSSSCKSGSCIAFDGVDDYVDIGVSENLNSTQVISISLWIKTNIDNSFSYVLGKRYSGGSDSYAFYKVSGNYRFYITTALGWIESPVISPFSVEDGNWHQLVGVYDGTKVRIYFDGLEVGSGMIRTGNIVYDITKHFIVNGFEGGYLWSGSMDNIRIYRRALTAQEILNIYNSGQ